MPRSRCVADRPRSARRLLTVVVAALLLTWGGAATAVAAPVDPAVPADPATPTDPADPEAPRRPATVDGGAAAVDDGDVTLTVDGESGGLSRTVVVMLLLSIAAVAPGILLLTTTFTRFVVVLGLTKNALGLQNVPPSQVLVGLALFLSLFSMSDVFAEVNEQALQPMLAGDIEQTEAFATGFEPIREFMLDQTRDDDLELFIGLSDAERPESPDEVGASTLIPAFIISELRTAFTIGFVIFIPFLVIDLVVAAVLMSMGMMMLPPALVSLPMKLLLFVLVDGWVLIAGSLVNSVQ